MLHRSTLYPLAATALVLAACGTGTAAAPRATPSTTAPVRGAVVHVQSGDGITTLGVQGGEWTAPGGVATPDGATIFTVASGRLHTIDGLTGAERASQPVAAGLRPVVASADAEVVALTDSPSRIGEGVMPVGRARSTIAIAGATRPRTFTVDGNVLPEGFSSDHSRLLVIDFLPATHPDRYRVRSMDLASGALGPVFTFDKTIDTEEMRGLSRTQVFSDHGPYGLPSSPFLYTLYSRAGSGTAGYEDVHVLSLDTGFVHCTDLPAGFGAGAGGGAIAVSPDGKRVYVASAGGAVAEVDTSTVASPLFPVLHTAHFDGGGVTPTVALVADNDGAWLGLGTRLVRLSATDLHPVTTAHVDQPLYALAAQADGSLYAATSHAVESIAPGTGSSHVIATVTGTPVRLTLAATSPALG